ncbi:hypothetical protein HAX54_027724, partial [Datura stramonium]|nr:hypothetical protein [Datura stramonium]
MDRRILGLSVLTLMICSLLVTKTWADEEKNPETTATTTQNPNPEAIESTPAEAAAAASSDTAETADADIDAHDSDENYVSAGGFSDPQDQFGPEIS